MGSFPKVGVCKSFHVQVSWVLPGPGGLWRDENWWPGGQVIFLLIGKVNGENGSKHLHSRHIRYDIDMYIYMYIPTDRDAYDITNQDFGFHGM